MGDFDKNDMTGWKQHAINATKEWVLENAVILDTETTGLDSTAQAIEISVCDIHGQNLFHTRLWPSTGIAKEAQAVHGISMEDLEFEPTWPDVVNQLVAAINNRPIVSFNAEFDDRIIQQTAQAFGTEAPFKINRCAMFVAAIFNHRTKLRISLKSALEMFGLDWEGRQHTATADALMTSKLIRTISEAQA